MSNEACHSIQFNEDIGKYKLAKRFKAQEKMYNERYEAAEEEIHLRHTNGELSNYKECCFQGAFDS